MEYVNLAKLTDGVEIGHRDSSELTECGDDGTKYCLLSCLIHVDLARCTRLHALGYKACRREARECQSTEELHDDEWSNDTARDGEPFDV